MIEFQVRPEDIDLPPCVPPPPSTQPPPPISDGSALSGEAEKKATPDPALKAKTKRMIEMQLKFSRKKLRDTGHSSVVVAPSSETINTSGEHAPLPRQPSDSPENIDKIESPKERPPPPPMHVPTPDPSIPKGPVNNTGIREPFNTTLDGTSKSLDLQIMQKLNRNSSDDSEMKKQAAVLHEGPTSVIQNVSDNAVKTSANMAVFEGSKLSSDLCRNLTSEFQVDNQVLGKEVAAKQDERFSGSRDKEINSGKQPELVLADVAVKLDVVSEKQPQDNQDIEEEKVLSLLIYVIEIFYGCIGLEFFWNE